MSPPHPRSQFVGVALNEGLGWRSLEDASDSLAVLEGRLSPTALALVTEWAAVHRDELLDAWKMARRHEPLSPIAPLE